MGGWTSTMSHSWVICRVLHPSWYWHQERQIEGNWRLVLHMILPLMGCPMMQGMIYFLSQGWHEDSVLGTYRGGTVGFEHEHDGGPDANDNGKKDHDNGTSSSSMHDLDLLFMFSFGRNGVNWVECEICSREPSWAIQLVYPSTDLCTSHIILNLVIPVWKQPIGLREPVVWQGHEILWRLVRKLQRGLFPF